MADDKKNAYGGSSGDANFRRTWDRAEWAAKAKEREEASRAEGKARAEAKAAGKKYYAPLPPDADIEMTSARRERINFSENLNKTTLVPAGAGVGKKGRSVGFYCEACDLTYKDSLQWVDHLNSKQHLVATGKTGDVKAATLEGVLERLAWLKRLKQEREKGQDWDLKKRLEERAKEEEEVRIAKREKRKEARKRKRAGEIKAEEREQAAGLSKGDQSMADADEEEDPDAIAMARMMGFSGGFGSTKQRS